LAAADLAPLGITGKSVASIKALARALCSKEFAFESSRTLQETISRLSAIEGVGEEMAHYIAMRASGEPDAFPLNSQALRVGEAWRPWRAYAAMHLWAANSSL
jgi:AraC family transcriptional regulator of adaptative response / DNA-3-methyladenine glycosylase II